LYHGPTPPGVCHCRPFQFHGLNYSEVWVEIPIDPMAPWIKVIIESEVDDSIEKMHYRKCQFIHRFKPMNIA
jgi:hypothetical protein